MTAKHRNLASLVDLAKEGSSDKRRELLRSMTDLFMEEPDGHSDRESAQFGDIMGTVARDMEMEVRRALATRLSTVPNAPRNLILQLASDEIAVAQPVLSKSSVLKEPDLIAIAKLSSQDHLHAVAGRANVSAAVSDALVARGDDRVLARLVGNDSAEISRESLEMITERAQTSEILHKPVVNRPNLPPDLLNSMFFAVSSELKRAIMSKMQEIDPSLIDGAIRQTERRMKMRAAQADPEQAKADAYIASLAKSGTVTESLLITLSKQKRPLELAIVLARLTALDLRTAKRLLADPNPEALAIASRACRFDRQTFSTIALNRGGETRSVNETFELLDLYDKVPVEAAQRVMRFWRVRQGVADKEAA